MFRVTILEGKVFKVFILDLIMEYLLAKIPSEFFIPLIEFPVSSCLLAFDQFYRVASMMKQPCLELGRNQR